MLTQYRRLLILLAILVAAVLAAAQQGYIQPGAVGRAVPELVRPFQAVLTAGTRQVQETIRWFEAVGMLADERRQEEQSLQQLAQLNLEVRLLAAENRRLRRLLGLQERLTAADDDPVGVVTIAEVIGRNPDTWFEALSLNKGERHGVSTGMAVVVPPMAAVGRIVQTTANTSQAMLLLDPESAVGAVVEHSGEAGVIFSSPGLERQLIMRFFDTQARVQTNRLVVTSGLAGDYPRGLLVGVIAAVRTNPATAGVEAVVQPVANFNRLEEVLIIEIPAGQQTAGAGPEADLEPADDETVTPPPQEGAADGNE